MDQGYTTLFVCGNPHRANERHPRHEVTAAIRKLQVNYPSDLLTVADLDCIK